MYLMRKWQRWVRWFLTLFCLFIVWLIIRFLLFGDLRPVRTLAVFEGRPSYGLWSPYGVDEMWLHNVKNKRSAELPLVIVEEHYEVIKYWYQSAQLDFLPKSKNTLIHIDAHIDGAVPYDVDSLPWFRFPHSDNEIKAMMQRNDMFITAAILSGFIDHVIWVWPSWDADSHKNEKPHEIIDFEVGYLRKKDWGRNIDLCACWSIRDGESPSDRDKDGRKWECHRRNFTNTEVEDGPEITRSECTIESSGVIETMREDVTPKLLKEVKFQWPGFILDVDEDFFGVWSDMFMFNDTKLSVRQISEISELVSDLWCAVTAQQESHVDRMFTSLVHMIINLKSIECGPGYNQAKVARPCLTVVDISNAIIESIPKLLFFLSSFDNGHLLCGHDEKANGFILKNLLSVFLNLNVQQLQLLAQIGLCFDVSPTSVSFSEQGLLHVCHGANIPGNTKVSFSLPNNKDIVEHTKTFQKVLSALPQKPELITVCRSVRDGYTPKEFFRVIESAVLTSVTSVFRSVSLKSVHFDGNLLGGALGWPERIQGRGEPLIQILNLERR